MAVRLAVFISGNVDRRLRLYALQQEMRPGAALSQFLDQHLPSAAELAQQVSQGVESDGPEGS